MNIGTKKFISSPFFATIVTCAVILTGIYSSLYTNEIKDHLLPLGFENGEFKVYGLTLWFWVATLGTAFIYFYRERVIERVNSELRFELVNQIQKLPPSDFMSEFAVAYDDAEDVFSDCSLPGKSKDEIMMGIRGILACLCQITEKFDASILEFRDEYYSANIMLFVPQANINATIKQRIKFVDADLDYSHLAGALDLIKELSTSSANEDFTQPDTTLIDFALPIPASTETRINGKDKSRVLPGAPMAFCKKRTYLYADTKQLFQWADEEGDFPESVKSQIKEYFNNDGGKTIGSFLSIPLLVGPDQEAIGVVNIHKPGQRLLIDNARLYQFEPLLRPYRHMLTKLVLLWK